MSNIKYISSCIIADWYNIYSAFCFVGTYRFSEMQPFGYIVCSVHTLSCLSSFACSYSYLLIIILILIILILYYNIKIIIIYRFHLPFMIVNGSFVMIGSSFFIPLLKSHIEEEKEMAISHININKLTTQEIPVKNRLVIMDSPLPTTTAMLTMKRLLDQEWLQWWLASSPLSSSWDCCYHDGAEANKQQIGQSWDPSSKQSSS